MRRSAIGFGLVYVSVVGCTLPGKKTEDAGPQEGEVRATITPSEGGALISSDSRMTLTFPPGAVTEETEVTVREVVSNSDLPAALPGMPGYELGPDGLQLAVPARMTLRVPQGLLTFVDPAAPPGPPGTDLSVQHAFLISTSGETRDLPSDQQMKQVGEDMVLEGNLHHFSQTDVVVSTVIFRIYGKGVGEFFNYAFDGKKGDSKKVGLTGLYRSWEGFVDVDGVYWMGPALLLDAVVPFSVPEPPLRITANPNLTGATLFPPTREVDYTKLMKSSEMTLTCIKAGSGEYGVHIFGHWDRADTFYERWLNGPPFPPVNVVLGSTFKCRPPPAPQIASVTPDTAVVGTQVVIKGTDLTDEPSEEVDFGGVAATVIARAKDGTSLTVRVPAGATSGPVTVKTEGGQAAAKFTVVAPGILYFNPTGGPPGTRVDIFGKDLGTLATTEVDFNGTKVVDKLDDSGDGTRLGVLVPAGATTGLVHAVTPYATATSPGPFTVDAGSAQPSFDLVDMGDIGTGFVRGLNDQGHVVGTMGASGNQPFIWRESQGFQALGTAANNSAAIVVNNSDLVAGTKEVVVSGFGRIHVVTWDSGGNETDRTVNEAKNGKPMAISGSGVIVGTFDDKPARFDYTPPVFLDTAIGDANAVDSLDAVAGSRWGVSESVAYLWRATGGLELGNTCPVGQAWCNSVATAMNEGGDVVGYSEGATFPATTFIWNSSQGIQSLGTDHVGKPVGISLADLIVGTNTVWKNGTVYDAPTLCPALASWFNVTFAAVSQNGLIAGYGMVQGTTHGFLLKPRP